MLDLAATLAIGVASVMTIAGGLASYVSSSTSLIDHFNASIVTLYDGTLTQRLQD